MELGAFDYKRQPEPDGVKITKMPRKEMVCGITKFSPKGSSGWEYEGEINLEGKRHGRCAMIWTNGSLYEGYWKADKMHGHGRLIYGNGSSHYIGQWKYGKKEGIGKEIFSDGTFYDG